MNKKYSDEQRQQILLEVEQVGNVPTVARKYDIPSSTIHTWLKKQRRGKNSPSHASPDIAVENKKLKKQLSEKETEIAILQDLLKKTYAVWNKN